MFCMKYIKMYVVYTAHTTHTRMHEQSALNAFSGMNSKKKILTQW